MFKILPILAFGLSTMALSAPNNQECADLEAQKDPVEMEEKYKAVSEKLKNTKEFKVSHKDQNLLCMHTASTLLISCVDFRLRDETFELMNDVLNLTDDYDELVLPGASLALVNDKYPHWGQSINEIIGLLKKLHSIKRVIFLDHRNCGAYRLILGQESIKNRETETKTHTKILNEACDHIHKEFPKLETHKLLMGLDGTVERID